MNAVTPLIELREDLRLLVLDAVLDETEDRDTYADGYSAGLIEALRLAHRAAQKEDGLASV